MKLRPYQSEACRKIIKEFEQGIKKTLLILPTGCGKTIVFAGVAFKFAYNPDRTPKGKKVLVLAHQNILIDQAVAKFEAALGIECDRIQGRNKLYNRPVSVSTVQSMRRRLERYAPDYFDLLIIDEAHHSMSAGYRDIIDHFADARLLGVTATPDRADKKKLECFESVAFRYTIGQAINDGYLSPMTVIHPDLVIDLSEVKRKRGDFSESDLGTAIEPYLHRIAEIVHEEAKGRRIVCFVPLIRTAQKAADIFGHYGFKAAWTSGIDKESDAKLKAFASGEYDIIFNSMLLTEGWDCPETDCVIVLRPTTSRALYVQMVGRGLRLADGKKDCLLIDFLFQDSEFDLASPDDVLGINPIHEPGTGPENTESSEGEGSDAEERLAQRLANLATFDTRNKYKDVLETVNNNGLFDPAPSSWQIRKLKELGIHVGDLTYSEAKAILDYEKSQKPPSDKMLWRLRTLGIPESELTGMSFAAAQKTLSKYKAMGRW